MHILDEPNSNLNLRAKTVGGMVRAAEPILDIVPAEDVDTSYNLCWPRGEERPRVFGRS